MDSDELARGMMLNGGGQIRPDFARRGSGSGCRAGNHRLSYWRPASRRDQDFLRYFHILHSRHTAQFINRKIRWYCARDASYCVIAAYFWLRKRRGVLRGLPSGPCDSNAGTEGSMFIQGDSRPALAVGIRGGGVNRLAGLTRLLSPKFPSGKGRFVLVQECSIS